MKTPAFDRVAREGALFTELTAQGDPRLRGEGDVFDQYPCADLSDRGFYERFMRGETKKLPGWVEPTDFEKQPVK